MIYLAILNILAQSFFNFLDPFFPCREGLVWASLIVFIYLHRIGFNELLESGYTYLLPPEVPTNISRQNLKGNQNYDNIWVSSEVHKRKFSGVYGVIREGLQIRTEASTVGSTGSTVSDHCPVWAEFQHT